MFYIMFAYHYDKKKVNIADILEMEGANVTVHAAQREGANGKMIPIYLVSHGKYDGSQIGLNRYTQDTGMGHTNKNKRLLIESSTYINQHGLIENYPTNPSEKRSIWVCK